MIFKHVRGLILPQWTQSSTKHSSTFNMISPSLICLYIVLLFSHTTYLILQATSEITKILQPNVPLSIIWFIAIYGANLTLKCRNDILYIFDAKRKNDWSVITTITVYNKKTLMFIFQILLDSNMLGVTSTQCNKSYIHILWETLLTK